MAKSPAGNSDQANHNFQRQLRRYRLIRLLGILLVSTGAVVLVSHWFSHVAEYHVIGRGWDDLVIGYPAGMAIAVVGFVVLGRNK
jgi:hypothetical protein